MVKLNEVLLNIFSNFIPNKIITIRPQQSPWITQPIKNFIRKKNLAYKNFVKNGQPPDKLEGIQNIFSNLIPNKIITIRPQQSPWITQPIKNCIRKKNLAYKNFVKNGQPPDKLEGIQNMT